MGFKEHLIQLDKAAGGRGDFSVVLSPKKNSNATPIPAKIDTSSIPSTTPKQNAFDTTQVASNNTGAFDTVAPTALQTDAHKGTLGVGKTAALAGKNMLARAAEVPGDTVASGMAKQAARYRGLDKQTNQLAKTSTKTTRSGHTIKNPRKETLSRVAQQGKKMAEKVDQDIKNEKYISTDVGKKVHEWNEKVFDETQRLSESGELGTAGKFFVDLAGTVGAMAPAVGISVASGGTFAPAGLGLMGEQVLGSTYKNDLAKGVDSKTAWNHAWTTAAIEVGTEALFGGIAGFNEGIAKPIAEKAVGALEKKGVLQAIAQTSGAKNALKVAEKVTPIMAKFSDTRFAKNILPHLKNMGEEGLEEVIADYLQPLADRHITGIEADSPEFWDVLRDFALGAVTAGALNTITGAPAFVKNRLNKAEATEQAAPQTAEGVTPEQAAQEPAVVNDIQTNRSVNYQALEAAGVTPAEFVQSVNDLVAFGIENTTNPELKAELQTLSGKRLNTAMFPAIQAGNLTWEDAQAYVDELASVANEYNEKVKTRFDRARRSYMKFEDPMVSNGIRTNSDMDQLFMTKGGVTEEGRTQKSQEYAATIDSINTGLANQISDINQQIASGAITKEAGEAKFAEAEQRAV